MSGGVIKLGDVMTVWLVLAALPWTRSVALLLPLPRWWRRLISPG